MVTVTINALALIWRFSLLYPSTRFFREEGCNYGHFNLPQARAEPGHEDEATI